MKRKALDGLIGRASKCARLTEEQERSTAEHYICPICKELANDGVIVQCCEKVFCRSCMAQHMTSLGSNCPHCRRDLDDETDLLELKAHLLPWGIYNDLNVSCGHDECKWKGRMEHHRAHATTECAFRIVRCESCKNEMPFKTFEEHKCDMRPETCPFCSARVPAKFMATHKQGDKGCVNATKCPDCEQVVPRSLEGHKCPKQKVACGICAEQVPRAQMLDHDRKQSHPPWARLIVQEKSELEDMVQRLLVNCPISVRRGMSKPETKVVQLKWKVLDLLHSLEVKEDSVDVWMNKQRVHDKNITLAQIGVRDQTAVQLVTRPPDGDPVHVCAMIMDAVNKSVVRVHALQVPKTATARYVLETLVALGETPERMRFLFHGSTRLDKQMNATLVELKVPLDDCLFLTVREK